MAKQAKSAIASKKKLKVVADRGYYRGEEFMACDKANIITYVPKPDTSGNRAKGQFGRDEFHYIGATARRRSRQGRMRRARFP